jgi:hypothetical protein
MIVSFSTIIIIVLISMMIGMIMGISLTRPGPR